MQHVWMSVPAFYYVGNLPFNLAFGASVVNAVVLDDLYAWLYYLYLPAYEFFPDTFKGSTAFITDPLILINIKIYFLLGEVGEFLCHCGLLLSGMLLDGDELLFGRVGFCLFCFNFIEKTHLAFDIIVPFFAGSSKEFFGKIVDLFLKDLLALVVSFDRGIQLIDRFIKHLDCIFEALDRVFKLYDLTVSGIFCH